MLKIKNITKLGTTVTLQVKILVLNAAHSISNLKYSIPKDIPIVFHTGSNYDYDCIIKESAEQF